MIGYTLAEIRRLLVSLDQARSPDPDTPGPGPAGAENASTRPGSATTGDAATHSHEWQAGGLFGGSETSGEPDRRG